MFLFLTACPDTPEPPPECGPNQVLNASGDDCDCAPGYHWNEDQTKCLMDTTSHNFVFYEDQVVGDPLTSGFFDVSIINGNNIWAVGYIETDEYDTSTGFDYSKYNAAHWDGNEWTLKKIVLRYDLMNMGQVFSYYDSSGQEIRGVYYIDNELWFMSLVGGRARLINGTWDYFEDQYGYGLSGG